MRLRKVPLAKSIVENSDFVIKDYTKNKKNFKKIFKNNNPIYLEIGMGKGNFIIQSALRNPNINYIGIEKYDSVLVRAIEKLEDSELKNLKFINMDAEEIDNTFSKEIDLLYLNFSDPWPKKRHTHRRLTSDEFLNKYTGIFKNTPTIELKTDNRKFFEFSCLSFLQNKYKIEELSLNLHEDNDIMNIQTEYEMKWSKKGYPIYKVRVSKIDKN